jgi:uncharacterized repeat protein (TIGR03803 family)
MKSIQPMILVAFAAMIVVAFFDGLTCSAATLYVSQTSPNPTPPYATWATSAHTIEDAIDEATAGDEVVVTNGVYASIAIGAYVRVRSVNGPVVTVIEGAPSPGSTFFGLGNGAVRCAYLNEGALLSGFTLTNGYTRLTEHGGGAYCEPSAVLTNCIVINCRSGDTENDGAGGGVYQGILDHCWLIGNVCHGEGGGAASSTLFNCVVTGNASEDGGGGVSASTLYNSLVTGNRSPSLGGGAFHCTLINCTVVANLAGGDGLFASAGGVYFGTLSNCIVYSNTAAMGANYISEEPFGSINFTCTFPLPTNGVGNITNEPAFVNAATGNYRLRTGSPCIDAGTNLSAMIQIDLAGRRRPMDGNRDGFAVFDMGAYEFGPAWPSPAQLAFQPLAIFGMSDDESQPTSLIQGRDGHLYGTVSSYRTLPPGQTGSVFRLRSSGEVNILAAFPVGDTNGFAPDALVQAMDGTFYGALTRVAGSQCGTIFRLDPSGARTNIFYFGATNGCSAWTLVAGFDGNLYGLANNIVFKLSPSGVFTPLHTNDLFEGQLDSTRRGLIQGVDGHLYGYYGLTVFRLTTAGVFTLLATVSDPESLVQAVDGNFYGTDARGGDDGFGSVFRLTPAGVLTTLVSFHGTNGVDAQILIGGVDGNLYGATEYGGPDWTGDDALGSGTVFQITLNGTLTTLAHSLPRGDGLSLYEMLQGMDGTLYLAVESEGLDPSGIFRLAPRPVLTGPRRSGGRDVLTWTSFTGGNYQVEQTPSLSPALWSVFPTINATSDTASTTNEFGPFPERYYRVRLLP